MNLLAVQGWDASKRSSLHRPGGGPGSVILPSRPVASVESPLVPVGGNLWRDARRPAETNQPTS